MTAAAMLHLKQTLACLTQAERKIASAYLLRLKHDSAQGRRRVSKLMSEMDAGKKTALTAILKA